MIELENLIRGEEKRWSCRENHVERWKENCDGLIAGADGSDTTRLVDAIALQEKWTAADAQVNVPPPLKYLEEEREVGHADVAWNISAGEHDV